MSDSQINQLRAQLEGILIGSQGEGSYGEIDHTANLSDNFGSLFLKDDFCDVIFLVENERFPAHRVLLAARSEYFRALLFGSMRESREKEVALAETNVVAFRMLLRYIYTGRLSLAGMREEMIMDVLALAHKYGFTMLQNALADNLKAMLSTRNLCQIYNISQLYMLQDLTEYCLVFADRNASELLNSTGFLQLTKSGVEQLISRDSFCAIEIDIFIAIKDWVAESPDERMPYCDDLMKLVRLPLIVQEKIFKLVRPSGLIPPDCLLDAIAEQLAKRSTELCYRGFMTPNTNIATTQLGATVKTDGVLVSMPYILTGDLNAGQHDSDRSTTKHNIGDERGIEVQLGSPYIINCLRIYLPDKEQRMYSYYVEMSMDSEDWVRVIDYSQMLCKTKQILRFQPRSVKYIRVVGTHNTQSNIMFYLSSFEALYCTENIEIDSNKGIIVAQNNMATIENNAVVLEGVSRCRNALINGETANYDWDNGYTCHQLGSGAITVQLPQPYIISNMRLLLWDCDDRYYSYYIEVSVDQQSWKKVADRTDRQCRAWQFIEFPARPVVFVRIVGTQNSANEVFHCVHFECPAIPDSPPVDPRSVIPPIEVERPVEDVM